MERRCWFEEKGYNEMKQDQIEKHSTIQSIILHLLPGILIGCFYLLARQPVANMGYPSIIALILAYAFILIPVELGYLLYQGKKKTGHFTLEGIISYRNSIPWWQYLVWVTTIVIAIGADGRREEGRHDYLPMFHMLILFFNCSTKNIRLPENAILVGVLNLSFSPPL